jgi:hypothetical protein
MTTMPGKRHAKQHAGRLKRKRIAHIPGFTNEFETAEELGVSIRTLRQWRQFGIGPPWTAVGRQIHYNDESRAAWLKSCEVQPVRSETVITRMQQDHAGAQAGDAA